MIINPYLVLPSVSYDPDAQAFFNAESAAGVTLTSTQQNATNQLVLDLKAANIWTKMKAVYPIVGGTATAHKFNLKNPLDTNAAYRLVFNGGWTHSTNGALPNGTNGYASTFLIPNTVFGAGFASVGVYVNQASTISGRPIGSTNMDIILGAGFVRGGNKASTSSTALLQSPDNGFIVNSRTSSASFFFMNRNRAFQLAAVTAATYGTTDIVLGATNTNGTIASYSDGQIAFAYCSDFLTQNESLLLYQITEKYQVALSRSVYTVQSFYYNPAYNNETNLFLFSTQITDNTIQTATNTLVNDLKTANIWTKMKAVYPMVGGTATTHKFNLVNAQDTDAAFRLVFAGGVTHSSSGVKGNNTNGWADTKLSPMNSLTLNSFHCAFNIYNDASGSFPSFFGQTSMGTQNTSSSSITLFSASATNQTTYMGRQSSVISKTVTATTHKGFWCGSRTANNVNNLIDPTGAITLESVAATYTMPSTTMGLLAQNNGSIGVNCFSNFGYSFYSIGDGLTPAEMTSLKTAVDNFQATLGRI